jgi:hypothetical protein
MDSSTFFAHPLVSGKYSIRRYIQQFMSWLSYTTHKIRIWLVQFQYFRVMPFTPPAISSAPYASLPRPPVGTVLYDRVYNDDLVSIKVRLMNMLNTNRLRNMPMGFPFRVVSVNAGHVGSYVSRESYEFQEYFCPSDHRGRTQTVNFSFTAPSTERDPLSWRITVPSRESSLDGNITCTPRLCIFVCMVD